MIYWYNENCNRTAITTDSNKNIGEEWIEIKYEEYQEKAKTALIETILKEER